MGEISRFLFNYDDILSLTHPVTKEIYLFGCLHFFGFICGKTIGKKTYSMVNLIQMRVKAMGFARIQFHRISDC